jgi:hypothetical protein
MCGARDQGGIGLTVWVDVPAFSTVETDDVEGRCGRLQLMMDAVLILLLISMMMSLSSGCDAPMPDPSS